MDLTLQQLLDVDYNREIDNVINSHPDHDLNLKELLPLDLDVDSSGCCSTETYGCFGSQSCLHGMSGWSNCEFDLDLDSFNSMLVDPKLVIPYDRSIPMPTDDIPIVDDDCINFKLPEFESEGECYINTELLSLEHSQFGDYDEYISMQHMELQFDDFQNFENDLQTYIDTQQHEQYLTTESEVASSEKVYPKPNFSYPCLSALALKNSQTGKLLVTQIYSFIRKHFPYYRTAPKGWKNAVRHNLSHNKTFQKLDAATYGCPNKRSNLWSINPARAAKMDEELRKKSIKHSQNIRDAMSHPEQLEMLLNGEVKFEISSDDDVDDFMSDFLRFPSAKRQRTVEGEMEGLCVYEPAKRRKTSLGYLAMDVFAEE